MAKKYFFSWKTQGIWNFAKTQGISFGQVVNFLILKLKDTSIFATKISNICLRLDKSAKSVAIGDAKNKDNTENLKKQFQWVP